MARLRVCSEPGCPVITEGASRCAEHRGALEQARGTRQQRGYGAEHDKARRDLIAAGHTHCAHCGQPFTEANPMEAGHVTALRHGGSGGEYAPHCMVCNRGWRRTEL